MGMLVCCMFLCMAAPAQAGFNLGGISIELPGASRGGQTMKSPAPSTDAGLSIYPHKIEVSMNSPVGVDAKSQYMIRGKITYLGSNRVPAEYTEVYLCPEDTAMEGNVVTKGYYGKTATNTQGEFQIRAKPGNYVIFSYIKSFAFLAPATATVNPERAVYALSDQGADIMFKK